MLKVDYKVAPKNALFYGSAIGVLMIAVFTLPVLLVVSRLSWSVDMELDEEAEEEEVASEIEKEEEAGKDTLSPAES